MPNFFQMIKTPEDHERSSYDLIPPMTLRNSIGNMEAMTQEAFQMFIELVGIEPLFLHLQMVKVGGSMLQIAEVETLEEGT